MLLNIGLRQVIWRIISSLADLLSQYLYECLMIFKNPLFQ